MVLLPHCEQLKGYYTTCYNATLLLPIRLICTLENFKSQTSPFAAGIISL